MKSHPLKFLALLSLIGLLSTQLGLIGWLHNDYRFIMAALFSLPLLIPLRGLWNNRLYTYKWTGFLTIPYFLIGVSESFSNPELRLYSIATILFSCLLFITSIYYSRYLRARPQ